MVILYDETPKRLARLGNAMRGFNNTASEAQFPPFQWKHVFQYLQSFLRRAQVFHLKAELIERMSGDVDSDDLPFASEQVHLFPGFANGDRRFRHLHFFHPSKQRSLS